MYSFDGVSCQEQLSMDIPRGRSKSDGLVKKTLNFARGYSDCELDRTERFLEAEIRRESIRPPREKKVARLRLKGEHVLHSKYVLMTVVVLNLIDCALVLGELILDIHFIREIRNKSDLSSQMFIETLQARYPEHVYGNNIDDMDRLYAQLFLAQCSWSDQPADEHRNQSLESINVTYPQKRQTQVVPPTSIQGMGLGPSYVIEESTTNQTDAQNNQNQTVHAQDQSHVDHHHHEHSVWEHVAHGMHKASITILGILFVENILKLICMGKAFLIKKLEVFDALVVFISFVVDLILLKGLMEYRVQDAVFILTFLLPWRVIRVVNSLIVAVLDHEHFRLKMLYQEKKAVTAELKTLKAKEKGWDFHLKKIENFCESEGIPKWKIRQHTAMGRKQSTITSMASLALNGILRGMVLSPTEKLLLEESIKESPILGIISESEAADNPEHQTSKATESAIDFYYVTPDDTDKNDKGESIGLEPREHVSNASQNVHVDIEYAHAHPEHSIVKVASKGCMAKNVTFEPKEKRPLLQQHDSSEMKNSDRDDEDNVNDWT